MEEIMPKDASEFGVDKRDLKIAIIAFCQKFNVASFNVDLEFIDSTDAGSNNFDLDRLVNEIKFDITI
jgi:hypothetical protein